MKRNIYIYIDIYIYLYIYIYNNKHQITQIMLCNRIIYIIFLYIIFNFLLRNRIIFNNQKKQKYLKHKIKLHQPKVDAILKSYICGLLFLFLLTLISDKKH